MQIIKKIAVAAALAVSFAASASASVIQSSAGGSYDGYQAWGDYSLGSVTFADGTNHVDALTTSAKAWDQGWGGEWADANQVYIGLFQGNKSLWTQHVAGAAHGSYGDQAYNIANDATALANLNTALASIDWSLGQPVTMTLMANPIGWGGWELHVRDAGFSVESEKVPEPASIALLGLGLAGIAGARRKSKKA